MPYLFDGYNLYHTLTKVSAELSQKTPQFMVELITCDMHQLRDTATVIFDGKAQRGQHWTDDQAGLVQVLYSGPQSDADTQLEVKIQDNTAPRRLVVVSSDRRVRRAARRRRAKSVTSPDYLASLFQRLNRPPPAPREPREKRTGVPDGQLGQWLELFGLDPNEPDSDDPTGLIQ
jgi:hypothetical protein